MQRSIKKIIYLKMLLKLQYIQYSVLENKIVYGNKWCIANDLQQQQKNVLLLS